jgi:hypothetical protein
MCSTGPNVLGATLYLSSASDRVMIESAHVKSAIAVRHRSGQFCGTKYFPKKTYREFIIRNSVPRRLLEYLSSSLLNNG